MKQSFNLTYYDRATRALRVEPVHAEAFLWWSYNTRLGQAMTDLLLSRQIVSRLYGWLLKRSWSRGKIPRFVRDMKVDVNELLRPLDAFTDFNDFFTREIDLSTRPVNDDPGVCIAPTDGKILAHPAVPLDKTFRIKRGIFNLRAFLRDNALAEKYANGAMVISRLTLRDYHHVHFPDSGTPRMAVAIDGKCYAGGPYATRSLVPFYTENHRMLTLFDSDHFGEIAIIEVGALTVGSIQQRYDPGCRVPRGAPKGFFELGGSTVVLLFEKGAIRLDDDLCSNSEAGVETYVRFGDSVGRA